MKMNLEVKKIREDEKKKADDGVFNYACRLLSYGLLSRNFQDGTKEGDGPRIYRSWKFSMLHFRTNGRTKYALEAFNLTAQINALLTPQLAHQLMWNRMCNTKGGQGKIRNLICTMSTSTEYSKMISTHFAQTSRNTALLEVALQLGQ